MSVTITTPETIAVAAAPAGWLLTSAELEATRAKIDKINTRAVTRGFTGNLTVEATPEKHITPIGRHRVTGWLWRTRIVGEAPSYGGWTVLAKITHDDNAGALISPVPGIEHTANWAELRDRAAVCEHCHTNRKRRHLYVVTDAAGDTKVVGATCLKDFTGWEASPVIITTDDLAPLWGGISSPREFTPEAILSIAVAAVGAYGFTPASCNDGFPTASVVKIVLGLRRHPDAVAIQEELGCYYEPDEHATAVVDAVSDHYEHAEQTAAKILDWLRSDDSAEDSAYMMNLRAIAAAEQVSESQINRLTSAVQAYRRWIETADERKAREAARAERESAARASKHVGEKGQRITVTVTVEKVIWITDNYRPDNQKPLYVMRSTDGDVIKWFASRAALPTAAGTELTITGTVKEHTSWNNDGVTELQTLITRVKGAA